MAFGTLISLVGFFSYCTAISITASNDPTTLAEAIFNGLGVTVVGATYQGATNAAGTFTDGPFGIGSGGILTTGNAPDALPGGNDYVNNGAAGSATYCGPSSFNACYPDCGYQRPSWLHWRSGQFHPCVRRGGVRELTLHYSAHGTDKFSVVPPSPLGSSWMGLTTPSMAMGTPSLLRPHTWHNHMSLFRLIAVPHTPGRHHRWLLQFQRPKGCIQ